MTTVTLTPDAAALRYAYYPDPMIYCEALAMKLSTNPTIAAAGVAQEAAYLAQVLAIYENYYP